MCVSVVIFFMFTEYIYCWRIFFFLVLIVLLQTSIAFSSTISSFPFTLFCIQRGEEGDISIGAIVSWGVLQVIKFHLMQ